MVFRSNRRYPGGGGVLTLVFITDYSTPGSISRMNLILSACLFGLDLGTFIGTSTPEMSVNDAGIGPSKLFCIKNDSRVSVEVLDSPDLRYRNGLSLPPTDAGSRGHTHRGEGESSICTKRNPLLLQPSRVLAWWVPVVRSL